VWISFVPAFGMDNSMFLRVDLACIAGLFVLSLAAIAVARLRAATPVIYGASLALSAVGLVTALVALLVPPTDTGILLPLGLPWIGMHFRLDALAAFFLSVVNLGGATASFYALGYGQHEAVPHRVLPFYPAFLAGMNLVVLADDAFTFLLCWELMSLVSWALVMSHHREGDNIRAGYIYLVMANFGTLALLLTFGLLAGPVGAYDFAAIRAAQHPPLMAALVLAFALLGGGSKAGLVPLHVWLPLAHPAAPSHVSGLMSGVMTKVAVYAFIRIVFDLLKAPSWWASMTVLALAAATALLGVLYALMQHDLKRLLAYHTVENIGIIFIGLGLALGFSANGMAGAAALALTAALFHVFNHSLFKSLLFFGAGSVLTETSERDMEKLGGLIHRMPLASFNFLVGCVAISALPPLNGFVSEWLTFQAILLSPALPQWGLKILIPGVGAVLALSAALAAACFVKAFGVTFLGRPRTAAVTQAGEADRWSLTAMFSLATLCLLAGILPGFVIDALAPIAQALVDGHMPAQAGIAWLAIVPINQSRSSYDGLLVFLFIATAAFLTATAIHRLASQALRRAPAWDCGFSDASPITQYTATSFAQPIRRVFGTIAFRARERVVMAAPGDIGPSTLTVTLNDLFWDGIYAPLARAVATAADHLNVLQFLTIRRYLSVVFVLLVALLVVIAIWL
jgi:formate hydrogenlyase subunit 3/multisubunit Na+/H+ antiporter MnhD subunit